MTETCKARARRWVHGFAAGGVAVAAIPNPVPGFTTGALITAEAFMAHRISVIYREPLHPSEIVTLLAGLGTVGQALKIVATQAADYIPLLGWAAKGVIAGSAIEGMGHLLVEHYEQKFPGREYVLDPEVEGPSKSP